MEEDDELRLNKDLCRDFPGHVVGWLAKYDVSVQEALRHDWWYSPSKDQLIFIFKDEHGKPICYQARNFSLGPKYYTQGPKESIIPVYRGTVDSGKLVVLVEDAVSAAKVARRFDAMPLLGSHLSLTRMSKLRAKGYNTLITWLDYDKWAVAVHIADQAKLIGFRTRVIKTILDPKEYDDAVIGQSVQV